MPWYVMRDLKRPNSLTPAWRELPEMGFHTFTPMVEQAVKASKGSHCEKRPYLPDLIFVKATREELDPVVASIPTLQYRYIRGGARATPMTVRDEDMDRFIKAVESDMGKVRYYSPDQITSSMYGRRVRIIGGTLDGTEGRLLSKRGLRGKRLIFELPGLLTATLDLEPDLIQLI